MGGVDADVVQLTKVLVCCSESESASASSECHAPPMTLASSLAFASSRRSSPIADAGRALLLLLSGAREKDVKWSQRALLANWRRRARDEARRGDLRTIPWIRIVEMVPHLPICAQLRLHVCVCVHGYILYAFFISGFPRNRCDYRTSSWYAGASKNLHPVPEDIYQLNDLKTEGSV